MTRTDPANVPRLCPACRLALGYWVDELGLDRAAYGTHSVRSTKATLIYRRTKNLRAVQLLLGHSKLDYLPRQTMSRCAASLQ